MGLNENFDFTPISDSDIKKCMKKLNSKKSTGVDQIPPKIIIAGTESLAIPIRDMANTILNRGKFPESLKLAQVTPIYKKEDPFIEKNYRPVSILPTLSKLYERVISDQLTSYFENIFNPFLAAFRPTFGCQTTLLRLVEDWKKALDDNLYVGAILMDLSKAFDCLPHDLIIQKLKAYGLSNHACQLMNSYLSDRKQRVKLGNIVSQWKNIIKGVPQGSILGPLVFNIFINDIFFFLDKVKMYNYADDNTESYAHRKAEVMKSTLESETVITIDWFDKNQMQANPDKFQAFSVGPKTSKAVKSFNINGQEIACQETVKLLGIEIDYMLNFDTQVSHICQKAARQLNVLQRLSKFLSDKTRLIIFKSFIQSNFNYCPIVWHFCSKSNSEKLEKLQFRALRIVFNDYEASYENLLSRVNMTTLHLNRMKNIAIETYKCLNSLSPEYIRDLVNYKSSNYNFRYENMAEIPTVRTTRYGKNSFRFESARVWNSLPNDMRKVENFKEFKRLIRTWTGPGCKCSICQS